MNRKMIFHTLGKIMNVEAVFLLLPALCALIYKEDCFYALILTSAIALVGGVLLCVTNKNYNKTFFAKEGFVIVALAWIVLSLIGALPFYISREIPNYIDAFFETVSGFTTTGASILTNVEAMSKSLLFWRSFTHWIGGMGIIMFVMAIMPSESGRSIHIMRAEVPGPVVGKLVPKISSTAKILYLIYVGLTVLEIIFLLFGKMPLFDALINSFGTAGTGGFSIKADGLASYSSYSQWVIAIFMLIFGINFNLYYLILTLRLRTVFKSEELWTYLGIIFASTALITYNIYSIYNNFSDAVRNAFFQVSSIITTTGYGTTDFNLWPELSRGLIFVLLFIGGCAGSTAGGFKLSRVIILFKSTIANLKHMVHPSSIESVKFEGKRVENETLNGILRYTAIYIFCLTALFLVVIFEPFDFETNITAAVSCFNNVGPGLSRVGPMGSYAAYSWVSKLALSAGMLLGRLEIYPLILLFSRGIWTKERKK